MSLMRQILDRSTTKAFDHRAAIDRTLDPGDEVVGLVFATHAGRSEDAFRMHVGGAHDTLARSLPSSLPNPALVITHRCFLLWDFGPAGDQLPGSVAFRTDRARLVSINRTGRLGPRRRTEVRICFTDGSWADYLVVDRERNAGFFLAATGIG